MKQHLLFPLFIAVVLLQSSLAVAQRGDSTRILSSSFILKVTNEQKGIIRYFSEDEEIIYRTNNAPDLKMNGSIEGILNDSIIVNGEHIAISDLTYLASKIQKREAHLINVLLAIAGGISITSGAILTVVGGLFTKIIGVTSMMVGTPLLIGGVTKYFTTNYLIPEKGWDIETVKLGGYPSLNGY